MNLKFVFTNRNDNIRCVGFQTVWHGHCHEGPGHGEAGGRNDRRVCVSQGQAVPEHGGHGDRCICEDCKDVMMILGNGDGDDGYDKIIFELWHCLSWCC